MKRTLLSAALVAATLAPVVAQAQDHDRRDGDHRGWDRRDGDHRGWDRRDGDRHWGDNDWREWREHHREDFRGGGWRAPFAYRVWGIGALLPRIYYAPNYYVNNWYFYHLPPPGYYLRYVRHYDDLLLVNVRNGRVVRVYRHFYD